MSVTQNASVTATPSVDFCTMSGKKDEEGGGDEDEDEEKEDDEVDVEANHDTIGGNEGEVAEMLQIAQDSLKVVVSLTTQLLNG